MTDGDGVLHKAAQRGSDDPYCAVDYEQWGVFGPQMAAGRTVIVHGVPNSAETPRTEAVRWRSPAAPYLSDSGSTTESAIDSVRKPANRWNVR